MPFPPKLYKALLLVPAGALLLYAGLRMNARSAGTPPNTTPGKQSDGTYLVPTGQTITPAGKNITFESRPVDMALSPDGRILAVMMPREVRLFDTTTQQFRQEKLPGLHNLGGIAWASDGRTLYTAGRARSGPNSPFYGAIFVRRFDSAYHATESKPILFAFTPAYTPNNHTNLAEPCGLVLSPDNKTLYASLFNNGTLATVDLTSYNPASGAARRVQTPVGSSPERVIIGPGGRTLYVANRGGKAPETGDTLDIDDPVVIDPGTDKVITGTVSVLDTATINSDPLHAVIKTIPVGLQPVDMTLSPDNRRLFVACSGSGSVAVVDLNIGSVVETVRTTPAPFGLGASAPNGLALSRDRRTLYVSLGGDNAIEMLTLGRAAGGANASTQITGLIPTAWFPLGILSSANGSTLYVINSKGIGSLGALHYRPNVGGGPPEAGPGEPLAPTAHKGHSVYSILGSLSVISVPDAPTLQRYSAQVVRNNHFDRMNAAMTQRPDPFWSRFKHVMLIIKENRTYDQVLGDMPVPSGHVGGDPHLVMFGKKVTPNHHALAQEFGLFDNLYCTGTISADGHHWLNEAFANDYLERTLNSFPRSYPCCGSDPLSYAGTPSLWQAAMEAGRSFRNYGEYPQRRSMKRYSNNDYNITHVRATPDRNMDVAHAEILLGDLTSNNPNNALPQLTYVWLSNDHTFGLMPKAFTPEACVADNDLALGKLVDFITHSKRYWQDEPTAIFVVEDDTQGGLDHVEGHRTVGFVISPYNRRGQVFSTNYNQLNMLRTIEVMLELKPLNQFDAAALPMRDIFLETPDFRPYTQQKNEIALNQRNPVARTLSAEKRHWAEVSAQLDFSAPDRADPEQLTEVLWHNAHGEEAYPPSDAALW